MGQSNFMDFILYASNYTQPMGIRDAADALMYYVPDLRPLTINSAGNVTFPLILSTDCVITPNTKYRTTTLTRYVRYMSQWWPALSSIKLQPLQDLIVKWATTEIKNEQWTFKLVEGTDIITAYSVGPQSCMRGKNKQLSLYVTNPDKVKLLKIMDEGKYVGRALVWFTDNKTVVMDRVYPSNGTIAFAARQYAKSQGWAYKDYDSIGAPISCDDVTITLKHVSNRRIPYLDTMHRVFACTDETLTLTNKVSDDSGSKFVAVGSQIGMERRVYMSNLQYIDGSIVVKQYVKGWSWYFKDPVISTVHIMHRGVMRPRAVRPTDVVYNFEKEITVFQGDKLVTINNLFYKRTDVRKVRNMDAYTPKAGSKGYKIVATNHTPNGATIHTLGVADDTIQSD